MKSVTMSTLGRNGRLGNQLFQIASLTGIARKNRAELVLPKWKYAHFFKGPFINGVANGVTTPEPHFHYHEFDISAAHDIRGYLQSEKYWAPYIEQVKEMFEFRDEVKSRALSGIGHLFEKEVIAIHIRRGDYVMNRNYQQLSPLYYLFALDEHFPGWRNKNLLFFSDDIEYCKIHFECLDNAFFSEHSDEIIDLCRMTMCDHHLISNSTFAWWGAYLSKKNGKVVCPARYFNGGMESSHSLIDFYPSHWVKAWYYDKKIDLQHVTFTIPFKYDSRDRMENFDICIGHIRKYFDTNIIVCENGPRKVTENNGLYTLMHHDNTYFHRTKMLNMMAMKATTGIIVNWDCDILIAPVQVYETVKMIEAGVDMAMPYDWRFARVPRAFIQKIKQQMDVGSFSVHRHTFIGFRPGDKESWGGCVFFNKASFIEGGMENENFISFGPEDSERRDRFIKLGYYVKRINGCLYHMDHFKGPDSGKRHVHFAQNRAEYAKVRDMSAEDLRNYVNSWPWTKELYY